MDRKSIIEKWKSKQIDRIFTERSLKTNILTSSLIDNTYNLLKAVNQYTKELLNSDIEIIEDQLPIVVVKPIQCAKCYVIVNNFDTIFTTPGDKYCNECSKKIESCLIENK